MNEVRIKETGERTLVVEFHGSVSAANAEEVGKELNAFRNENKLKSKKMSQK